MRRTMGWESRIAGILALMAVMAGVGCGLARRTQPAAADGQASESPADANALNVRVVPAGDDLALPDRSANLTAKREIDAATIEGSEITFEQNISLSDPQRPGTGKPLFFVWDERALGAPIIHAEAEHRAVDEMNRLQGDYQKVDVHQDQESGRWYLPFSGIFAGHERDVDPAILHLITLTLIQEGGKMHEFNLSFRARGTIPDLGGHLASSTPVTDPANLAYRMNGFSMPGVDLTNPTARRLSLWVRAIEQERAHMTTVLLNSFYVQSGNQPPNGPIFSAYSSEADLRLDSLWVQRGGGGISSLAFSPGNWSLVTLGPNEHLQLLPTVHPVPGTSSCSVPAAVNQTFGWTTPHCSSSSHGGDFCGDIQHSETHPNSWSIVGFQSTGAWDFEVRVADPLERRELALGSVATVPALRQENFRVAYSGRLGIAANLGTGSGGSAAFGCQGHF